MRDKMLVVEEARFCGRAGIYFSVLKYVGAQAKLVMANSMK